MGDVRTNPTLSRVRRRRADRDFNRVIFQKAASAPVDGNHHPEIISVFGIEVELKEFGNDRDLSAISKDLIERFPQLGPDAETKFEKGMRFWKGSFWFKRVFLFVTEEESVVCAYEDNGVKTRILSSRQRMP